MLFLVAVFIMHILIAHPQTDGSCESSSIRLRYTSGVFPRIRIDGYMII